MLKNSYGAYLGPMDESLQGRLNSFAQPAIQCQRQEGQMVENQQVLEAARQYVELKNKKRSLVSIPRLVGAQRNPAQELRDACLAAEVRLGPTKLLMSLIGRERLLASLSRESLEIFNKWDSISNLCEHYIRHVSRQTAPCLS